MPTQSSTGKWTRRNQDIPGLIERVQEISHPLQSAKDLDPLISRIGDARYVLLGEASHGTSEYYQWRREISQRLIEEKGFSFIAVEGDWPDCYRINRYVKGYPGSGANAADVLRTFTRWPTWMWANREIEELTEWLRQYNEPLPAEKRIGFYGVDVYSLWDSLQAVVEYLEEHDPSAAPAAREAYRCFEPFESAEGYARAAAWYPESCADEVVALLAQMRRRAPEYPGDGREARFNAEQNALVAQNAEHYYRTMGRADAESWNIRDRHMVETLERLTEFHEGESKAVVWEHNTHIGDARATDMTAAGMVNVGQLVREGHSREDVVLVGFGSYQGSVIAGRSWGAPMERMPVPAAREGSWEHVLHTAGGQDCLLIFEPTDLPDMLHDRRGHRAIGVVYHPEAERRGNYVPTVLPRRYDVFCYLDETRALHPIPVPAHWEEPETYPVGV